MLRPYARLLIHIAPPNPGEKRNQGCKFSGYSLNSGLREVQILALLFVFSSFWILLAWTHALFQAFSSGQLTSLRNGYRQVILLGREFIDLLSAEEAYPTTTNDIMNRTSLFHN